MPISHEAIYQYLFIEGRGIRPATPIDRDCGTPSAAPLAAIYELPVVNHSTYRVQAY